MPQKIIDLLNKGVEASNSDRFRQGNLIRLPAEGSVIITGDIHGHRRNFERIIAFADLDNYRDRHVVLQEVIHGGPEDSQGGCLSYKVLFDVVEYKSAFPDRVHIIMGNHATSFISKSQVVKNGREMNLAMRSAVDREFGQAGGDIIQAMRRFLFSLPLAVRCDSRIWISHSLPNDRDSDKFDRQIFDRQLNERDMVRPGSVYLLTWGRKHSQAVLDKMARLFDVDSFVLGHQPQQQGWRRAGDNLIIVASDHSHGCLLPVDLAKSYTVEELTDSIVALASVA